MAVRTWHPYAPDQAFGRQAAQDEELVDQILARLDEHERRIPRAANKATPPQSAPTAWRPSGRQLGWLAEHRSEHPATTAAALEAAPFMRP